MAQKKIRKSSLSRKLPRSRHWIAVGTLAAYSAAGSGRNALAADPRPLDPTSRSGHRAESLPVRRFAIAPSSLGDALDVFSQQTGVRVILPEDCSPDGLRALPSPGAEGPLTFDQALLQLLRETGLGARWISASAVQLRFDAPNTTVDVNAVAAALPQSLPKIQTPLLDTPQTVNVVSQKTMDQQGVTTLRDAIRNVAGISLAAGEGGAQGDNLTVRGFSARSDLFIDGMRDFGSYYRDSFNTEEVQVLQGPSSVLFGRGSTGGVVNQASKSPQLNSFLTADLQFGTDTTRRGALDWSVPVPKLGSGAAFRLNAMGNIGNVAERDVALNRRTGIAPSLAVGLGTPTRLTLSYFHQNEDNVPDYGLPWLFNQPAPVSRQNYYGVEGNFLRTYADIGTARLEHDVNSHLTLRDQFRYANYDRAIMVSEARVANATLTTPLSAIQVTRNQINARSTETFLANQSDAIATFETFGIRHSLVSGIEALRETSDPTRYTYNAPSTSLLNPNYRQTLLPGVKPASSVSDTAVSAAAYVLDTASIGKHLLLSGGVRYDRFDNSYQQTVAPASSFNRVDTKPTWRGAIVYKPVARGSFYFDAGTSFNPSAESLSLTAGSANLPPETNKTYEAGTKWEFGNRRIRADAAWFRTTKDNARESDPNNALLTVLAGTQRVSGVVANVHAHITSRWEAMSSYSYLDSRVVSSRFYPAAIGYPLVNVPKNTFSFWTNGRLPAHFEGGVGTNYVGSRNASSTVPLDPTTGLVKAVPGYWVFNAMLSHPLSERVDLQLNGYNLANRFYYDQLHPGHVVPGAGRTLLIGFKFKF